MSQGNFYGEYYHYKNKYEEAQEEIAELKEQLDSRQSVIESYQKWFKDREYLSTLPKDNQGSTVRHGDGLGVREL